MTSTNNARPTMHHPAAQAVQREAAAREADRAKLDAGAEGGVDDAASPLKETARAAVGGTPGESGPDTSRLDAVRNGTFTLAAGARGETVRQAQALFNWATGGALAIDGKFGPKTNNAITGFQRDQSLSMVDGIIGPETMGALDRAAAQRSAALPTAADGPVAESGVADGARAQAAAIDTQRAAAVFAEPPVTGPRVARGISAEGAASVDDGPSFVGPTLRRGDESPAVDRLQGRFQELGYTLDRDGKFGPETEGVVEMFQGQVGIDVDGVVGPETYGRLGMRPPAAATDAAPADAAPADAAPADAAPADAAPADAAPADAADAAPADGATAVAADPYIGPTLREGARGGAVNRLQARLQELGFTLEKDGAFGPETRGVVEDFQSQQGLDVDGVVGPDTYGKLGMERPDFGDGGTLSGAFTPNETAIARANRSGPGRQLNEQVGRHAEMYQEAASLTGVPASIIAAIHGQESGFGTHRQSINGPESGFGLDPRHVSNTYGNNVLRQHGLGTWQRGQNNATNRLQSAVIAAEHFKRNASTAGVEVGPQMSQRDIVLAATSYIAGPNSGITRRARQNGTSFVFNPGDNNPHPMHPGGTSIGRNGQTIRVPPGRKNGLLRWDVMLPMIERQLGGAGNS